MKIIIGGIYEISKEWHPYDEDIINHRPCIVIKEEMGYVYIILMDIFHSKSKKNKQIFIEYYIDNNKYISAISCDVIHRISKDLLIKNLGYVSNDIVNAIIQCNGNILPSTQYIKLSNKESEKDSDNTIINNESNILISDKEQMLKILLNIYQDINFTRKITEKQTKKINIWKERGIGFIFGFLSSLLATIIYENRFILLDSLYEIINELLRYITNFTQ